MAQSQFGRGTIQPRVDSAAKYADESIFPHECQLYRPIIHLMFCTMFYSRPTYFTRFSYVHERSREMPQGTGVFFQLIRSVRRTQPTTILIKIWYNKRVRSITQMNTGIDIKDIYENSSRIWIVKTQPAAESNRSRTAHNPCQQLAKHSAPVIPQSIQGRIPHSAKYFRSVYSQGVTRHRTASNVGIRLVLVYRVRVSFR